MKIQYDYLNKTSIEFSIELSSYQLCSSANSEEITSINMRKVSSISTLLRSESE